MAETLSLMEFLQALMGHAELRAKFAHDPQGTLVEHGLAGLSPADMHDAILLVQDSQTVDFALGADAYAPPPPLEYGGHEAAVEYLGRYLGQDSPAADEAWDDVDPDADIGEWDGSPTIAHGTTDMERTFAPSFGAGEAPGDGPGDGTAAASTVAGRKPVDDWAEDRPDAEALADLDHDIDTGVDSAGATPADGAPDDSDNAPYDGAGDPPGGDDLG
jgi:hypothetical protein